MFATQVQERIEEQIRTEATFDAIDWTDAACKKLVQLVGEGAIGLFFSDQIEDIRSAKLVCAQCPVAQACLALAVTNKEPWGVWGGELFVNGKPLAVKRPRGRPPKDAALARTA